MDTLTVKGLGKRVDGVYECDVVGMIDVSSDEALTVREAHFVKQFSGARGGEIAEGFLAGDMAVRAALARIVLERKGFPIPEATLWDMKAGWARFELGAREEEEEEVESPPTVEGETPSETGGTGSLTASEMPAAGQSGTGRLASVKSVASASETLAS